VKKTIALGGILLAAILFFIGSFFLYWGALNYLHGWGSRPAGLEYVMMGFGACMMFAGAIVIWDLVALKGKV